MSGAFKRSSIRVGSTTAAVAFAGFAIVVFAATGAAPQTPPGGAGAATQAKSIGASEVIVHVSDLPRSALSEFQFWNDPASPGGRLVGYPNHGEELDPPPENDPHVIFKVPVQRGVAYRCWVHMKVGKAAGKSQANLLFVQFGDAVDEANREVLKPGTGSYLIARGPAREGWTWTACELPNGKGSAPRIQFRTSGEVTMRLQAGMEGVGFDQVLLSPARFLDKAPSEAVVAKAMR